MPPDPIVEEIRLIRDRLAAEFNYDLAAIVKDAQQRDAAGDRLVARPGDAPPVPPDFESGKRRGLTDRFHVS